MARRNWISENQEAPGQVTISTIEKVTPGFLLQYSFEIAPQLFQGTQGNSLDMEDNWTPKSSSSFIACGWGRFGRLCHSGNMFRLAHSLNSAEGITKLDSEHFWNQTLKEKHQIKIPGPAYSNTVEDRNYGDPFSFLHSFHSIFNLISIMELILLHTLYTAETREKGKTSRNTKTNSGACSTAVSLEG